jgi:hypothetical protein
LGTNPAIEIQSTFDARVQIMTTSEEKNDPTDGDNPEEPIINKLIEPLVKPSPEGMEEEDDHSGEHRHQEETLPPGMPPLI